MALTDEATDFVGPLGGVTGGYSLPDPGSSKSLLQGKLLLPPSDWVVSPEVVKGLPSSGHPLPSPTTSSCEPPLPDGFVEAPHVQRRLALVEW